MNRVDIIESLERRTLFNALVFSKPSTFITGTNPAQIVTADLTNNGKADLITANFGSATIGILRGNGDGTFQPAVFYPVGASPEGVAIGDFNGDGIPDLVTANEGANTISVLIGIGDGSFAPQVTYPVGLRPEAVAVADFNGSGLQDIVTVDQGSDTISVLLNAGNGTFEPASAYFAGVQPSGLAVADLNADGRPDIVTTSPILNQVHVLLNNGDGAFAVNNTYGTGQAPRGVAVADLTSDARPDIITGNINGRSISLLQGNGNGTFLPVTNYIAGGRPLSVAIADVNGDGRPDVVTADLNDKDVAVLTRVGLAGFAASKSFRAGNGPTSAVVADLNGDGRPDIIAANYDNNTVSVLLNQTVFVPLIPTTDTLSPSQNPVEVKNGLVLSVQVTGAAASTHIPTGVVQFFDGNSVIGIAHVSPSGIAHVNLYNLSSGIHTITAHYGGDSIFAGNNTSAIVESVVPPQLAIPFVEPTTLTVHLPANYVPGVYGIADLTIRAAGAGPSIGTVGVHLYASASTTFDATAIPLQGSSPVRLKLLGNQSHTVAIGFHMPGNINPGNYTIFAILSPITGLTASQVSAIPAVGLTTQQAVLQFGAVSSQHDFHLTRTLANGNVYTLSLSGPGTGSVTENAGGGISIALAGTAGSTTLTIASATGVTLDGLTENSPIGTVTALTTNLDGAVHLEFGVRRLTLANASNCQLVLGGGIANILSLANLTNVNLFSGAPIASLSVNSYTNQPGDIITTAWIGSVHSTGDFGPSLFINGGTGRQDRGLNTATIGGAVGNSVWRIVTNVGAVQVADIAAGWSASVRGSIQSFVDLGDFAGQFAAHNIGNFQVDGNLTNSALLAGADFGNDGRLGNGDDTSAAGKLTRFNVRGNVTNSIIAAGLKPSGSTLLAPGAMLLPRSAIGSVTIAGTIDAPTRFLAVALPKTASINGSDVDTTNNINFGR